MGNMKACICVHVGVDVHARTCRHMQALGNTLTLKQRSCTASSHKRVWKLAPHSRRDKQTIIR